ncbi:hypothetical protein TNCV_3351271 [Trichonephila clavipes]|nr:hypothetical protein TNCV_3351271 [Trichonephila clavipes]
MLLWFIGNRSQLLQNTTPPPLLSLHSSGSSASSRSSTAFERVLHSPNFDISPREGCGSPVVKVSDHGQACHEFEPSTTKVPPCGFPHLTEEYNPNCTVQKRKAAFPRIYAVGEKRGIGEEQETP